MGTTITTGVQHVLKPPIPLEAFSAQLPVTVTFQAIEYAGISKTPTPVEVTVEIRLPVDSQTPHRLWKISGKTSDGRTVAGQIYLDDPDRSTINITSTEVLPRQPH